MDDKDRAIIRELQRNARITNQDLSERVNLSPTPCLRRVRRLEEQGVIKGYAAQVDNEAYGLPVMAFVSVRLEKQAEAEIAKFERGVERLEEVQACYLMSGKDDYLLQVYAESLKDYERFVRDRLTRIGGIGALETHFVFGKVKEAAAFPRLGS